MLVGKSSFLGFLERRIDEEEAYARVLAVRVTWLDLSNHFAWQAFYDISDSIARKLLEKQKAALTIPGDALFRESYTFAFNRVLRELSAQGTNRLVLMIDEFDVLGRQLSQPEKGFDCSFLDTCGGLASGMM